MVRYGTITAFTEFLPTVVEILNKPFVLLEKKGSSIYYFTETIFFVPFSKI